MVDVRPLLFANALALMLLVTAGFASVRDEQPQPDTIAPSLASTLSDLEPEPDNGPASGSVFREEMPEPEPAVVTERFEIDPIDANAEQLAVAEPVAAMAKQTKTPPQPAPTTGTLILRSNVVGDQVTINGESYGATRLDLELAPGRYDIAIEKPGHQRWTRSIELAAGEELTLVGELEAFTSVNYRNGEWRGGIRTGDGTWQDDTGLRYGGHFVTVSLRALAPPGTRTAAVTRVTGKPANATAKALGAAPTAANTPGSSPAISLKGAAP